MSQVLQLHSRIIEHSGGAVGILNLGALESALLRPRMTFGGKDLYSTLPQYDDVLETVANPDLVLPGYRGSLIAVRSCGRRRHLFAIYRQLSREDGFIITAYFSSKINRKKAVWKRT